jgi:hypothetical protein
MHTSFHDCLPAERHAELLRESERYRRFAVVRRQARAARLTRRADALRRRATALVEHSHQ